METVIIVLLVLLVFLISCDIQLIKTMRNYILGSPVSADVDGFVHADESYDAESSMADGFLGSSRTSSGWEPSTSDFDNLDADEIFKSYAEDLNANVDRAIVESHNEYTSDMDYLATTGASHASARDDFMPAVQFHGLPRKAHYANVGAEGSARTAQSETPEAVIDIRDHNSSGYIL